eukprot:1705729-Prymnesium_polylepis.1
MLIGSPTIRGTVAATTAGMLASAVYYFLHYRLTPRSTPFTVLSWNVLAREFTMFNREPPGCVQGHHNPDDRLETKGQTEERYSLATDAILAQRADAVLLQELSQDFFDHAVNPRAQDLLAEYEIAHEANDAGPGTAVLLHKDSPLVNTGLRFTAGGSEEETGGTSKSASGVQVTLAGARCWLVSLHLTPFKYKPEPVRKHLQLLGDALRMQASPDGRPPPRIIVGGDLNAEPHEVATLQSECAFLGGALSRVGAPGPTGLSANFATPEAIDHMFVSPGLRLLDVALERPPESPYAERPEGKVGPAAVAYASDHVWQRIRVAMD